MNIDVPYMGGVKNLSAILTKIQNASCPNAFTIDFLKDLGFASSNDRSVIKVLKYIGFIDQNSKPLEPYKKYMDHTISKVVLGEQIRMAYDDLFNAHKDANKMTVGDLTGWFKTKTGQSESVAAKIATLFKALTDCAEFTDKPQSKGSSGLTAAVELPKDNKSDAEHVDNSKLSLVYRFEIHLPDTQNMDTYRAIFKAIKEELLK